MAAAAPTYLIIRLVLFYFFFKYKMVNIEITFAMKKYL